MSTSLSFSSDIVSKAGLFSAVVTAFFIESYKNLSQNSGDITIALLAQISNQLANGTNIIMPSPVPNPATFEVPNSALRVNALWILSLAFSLGCALAATLVQQWSRNYVTATHRRPTLFKRARIRSYLFEGLEKFGMANVVNIIPTLLHISLFLFFGGLFEFLRPINAFIGYFTLGILVVCSSLYMGTAAISAVCLNCPYQIPVSAVFWRIISFARMLGRRYGPRIRRMFTRSHNTNGRPRINHHYPRRLPKHMAEERESMAMKEYRDRDMKSLSWTLQSLTDNQELEPFAEGIPGFLSSKDIPAEEAISILMSLIQDPEARLYKRITNLLRSCSEIQNPAQIEKRRIASFSAFSAIAFNAIIYRVEPGPGHFYFGFPRGSLDLSTVDGQWHRWARVLSLSFFLKYYPNLVWFDTLITALQIPFLNSLMHDTTEKFNHREANILAFIATVIVLAECPFDPTAIWQLYSDIERPVLLSYLAGHLRVDGVRPRIQLAFVDAVGSALHLAERQVSSLTFVRLCNLLEALDDPASIQAAIALTEENQLALDERTLRPIAESVRAVLHARLDQKSLDYDTPPVAEPLIYEIANHRHLTSSD